MGAVPSQEQCLEEAHPFFNLQLDIVAKEGWQSFFDTADTFAIDAQQWTAVAVGILKLDRGDKDLAAHEDSAKRLFYSFDPDANGRVDAGELFTVLALVSDSNPRDRAEFFFRLMDYDDNDSVTIDEVLITLKSILVGSLKLRNEKEVPTDEMVLQIAERFFDTAVYFAQQGDGGPGVVSASEDGVAVLLPHENPDVELSKAEFVRFCVQCRPDAAAASLVGSLPARAAAQISLPNLLLLCSLRDMMALGLDIDSDIEQEVRKGGNALLPGGEGGGPAAARRGVAGDEDAQEDDPFAGGPAEGDEFMAVKPWLGAIKAPSRAPPVDPSAPEVVADIEWVHGYRAQDCRNNLRYTAEGCVVYHAAALGVVYDARRHAQAYHRSHTDDIVSLAVSPCGRYAATGQLGKKPAIQVWRTDAGGCAEALATLRGFHEGGVPLLAFSADGAQLASVGLDKNNSVAVYGVEGGADGWARAGDAPPRLRFRAKGNPAKPLHLTWSRDGGFVVCGVKSMFVYSGDGGGKGGGFSTKKGLFGRKVPLQTLLCACFPPSGPCVTGTLSGDLYLWSGRSCCGIVPAAHKGAVNACYCGERLLLTGGKDGAVCVWDARGVGAGMQPLARLDLAAHAQGLDLMSAQVRSVCADEAAGRVLVGTKGSEIIELDFGGAEPAAWGSLLATQRASAVKGNARTVVRVLARGHCADELWGLAVHPSGRGFATTGDDKTLRVWDVAARRMVQLARLPCMSRAVAYSPDGQQLALGLGGRVGRGRQKEDGGVLFLPATLDAAPSAVAHARDSKQWISDVKFSPSGELVAVGSHDNRVYVYHSKHKRLLRRLQGHSSYITHLDFSRDGANLQSNCGAYELLFWDAASGQQVTSASSLRNTQWDSWTCTLGWPVQGIWPRGADGTDVNAVDRAAHRSHPPLLAAADDFGKVRIFRYPCVEAGSSAVDCTGHSSHVMNVRWLPSCEPGPDGTVLRRFVSVGGNDRCIIQWRCTIDSAAEAAPAAAQGAVDLPPEISGISEGAADLHARGGRGGRGGGDGRNDAAGVGGADDPFAGGPAEGDKFMAVKPWLGAIKAPSARSVPRVPKSAPTDSLKLEWVHGYQGQSARENLRYSASGRVVYHAAGLGISLDAGAGSRLPSQRFNMEHDDDVVCLAVSPDLKHVATGQLGKRPRVVVWDAETGATAQVLQGFHKRAVTCVAFSPDGRLLATVGLDDNHSVAVYDWQAGVLRAKSKGDRGKVLGLAFAADGASFAQCGLKHARMWALAKGSLTSKKALFGKQGPPRACVAVAWWGGGFAAGTSEGDILLFQGRQASRRLRVHAAPVGCLWAHPTLGLLSGGSDGVIARLADPAAASAAAVAVVGALSDKQRAAHPLLASGPAPASLARAVGSTDGDVRSLCVHPRGGTLLVGTRGSDVFEVPLGADGAVGAQARVLVRGHCADELWGLAVHPHQHEYATVGDDKTLRVWDVATRRQKWAARLPCMSRAVAYSPDGQQLALGLGGRVGRGRQKEDGGVLLVPNSADNAASLKVARQWRDSKQWISDVKFSPDGQHLAVGSHDNRVYVYDLNSGRLRHTLAAHSSYITHLDFSERGTALQSNCGAYELLFWDLRSGQQNTSASSLRDEWWASWTCTLGWPVQGIWEGGADGTDVNAVDRATPRDWARVLDGAVGDGAGARLLEDLVRREGAAGAGAGLLATADDFGRVSLYHYPCAREKAPHASSTGHSSHVMNARWVLPVPRRGAAPAERVRSGEVATEAAVRLLTVGGNDRCVMQWFAGEPETQAAALPRELRGAAAMWALARGEGAGTGKEEEDDFGGGGGGYHADDEDGGEAEDEEGGGFGGADDDPFADGPAEGDEFMAVKPWLGTVEHTTPSRPPPVDASAPAEQPALEWVYGYEGKAGSNNVRYNVNGEVVYYAAAVGVIYDPRPSRHSQEHHVGHTNDITAFAMAASGRLAATGQVRDTLTPRATATVRVWDADTGALVSVLPPTHKNAVACLAFSPSGKALATVGADSYHRVALFTSASGAWSDAQAGAAANGDRAKTLFAAWGGEAALYTGGVKHVRSWALQGGKLRSKKVAMGGGGGGQLRAATCGVAHPAGDGSVVVGAHVAGEGKASTGAIFLVSGTGARCLAENAHAGGVDALFATEPGSDLPPTLVSGGRDGVVRLWSCDGGGGGALAALASVDLAATVGALAAAGAARIGAALASAAGDGWSAVRSVCLDRSGDRVLVGTRGCEVYEVDLRGVDGVRSLRAGSADADAVDGVALLVEGHCEGELWGLAAHPENEDVVATVGDEGVLRLWDANARVMLLASEVGGKGRCCAFSDDGRWLAVGVFGEKADGGGVQRSARLLLFEVTMEGKGGPDALGGLHLRAAGTVARESVPAEQLKAERGNRRTERGLSISETNFWISDVRFAPTPAGGGGVPRVAVATHYRRRRLCVFELRESGGRAKLAPVAAIGQSANSSAILHVDWSADGATLQTDDRSYELLFWRFAEGSKAMQQVKSVSSLRDEQWASWSCVLGWPVQGIWPSGADGTDINAVDRAPRGTLLATGDDQGRVNVFRYPCVKPGAACNVGLGHSSHVTNVRFSATGQTLFSAGGNDRSMMQWSLRR